MIRSRAILTVLSPLLLVLAPRLSLAQGGAEVVNSRADELFRQGIEAANKGSMELARVDFMASYGIQRAPGTLWNLAAAEKESNHLLAALCHARQWVAQGGGPKATQAERDRAHRVIGELLALTGHLDVHGAPPDTVSVDGKSASAECTEDPPFLAQGNGVFDVPPGRHTVEARGGSTIRKSEVTVFAGTTVNIRFETPDAPKTAPPPPEAPAPGVASTSARMEAPRDAQKGSPSRIGLTVGFGAAAIASLAAGVAFQAASNGAQSSAQTVGDGLSPAACEGSGSPSCAALKGDLDAQNRDQTLSVVFYAGAGAFAAGALAAWFLMPKTTASRSAIVPVLAPGVAGARWSVAF